MGRANVVILGIYAADLTFSAPRLPVIGETLLGRGFGMGPGGKGSNQVVAAGRAGANATFISRVGKDTFADMALKIWADAGVETRHVIQDPDNSTGAAFIFVSSETGDNAIIVVSGAAGKITPADVRAAEDAFRGANVFITQFEQPIDAAVEGLTLARKHGVTTILNPAPAVQVDPSIYQFCDYVTPNETEAAALTGIAVESEDDARRAAEAFMAMGAKNALITLGARGALLHGAVGSVMVPSFSVAKVVETTGAGDAFNGGFATALGEGMAPAEAVRFGCAVAGLSVQKPGTAGSMPSRVEIDAFMGR
jgi:ribokinase